MGIGLHGCSSVLGLQYFYLASTGPSNWKSGGSAALNVSPSTGKIHCGRVSCGPEFVVHRKQGLGAAVWDALWQGRWGRGNLLDNDSHRDAVIPTEHRPAEAFSTNAHGQTQHRATKLRVFWQRACRFSIKRRSGRWFGQLGRFFGGTH